MKKHLIEHWQVIAFCLIIYDIIVTNGSYFMSLLFRYEMRWNYVPQVCLDAFYKTFPIYVVGVIVIFYFCKLYSSIWRYASFTELTRCILASFLAAVLHTIVITCFHYRMPFSYYIMGAITQTFFIIGGRFIYRFYNLFSRKRDAQSKDVPKIMVVGAGDAGRMLLRDMTKRPEQSGLAVCFIDDNPNKWGRTIDGVPVVGGRDVIAEKAKEYGVKRIYIAIPSATAKERRELANICNETGCELKIIPGIYQLTNGEVSVSRMRNVDLEDLLGREATHLKLESVFNYLSGKTILVTGGGGSIGSELCRQIAAHEPGKLIVFDVYENEAYSLQQELKKAYPDMDLLVLIGSVRDRKRLDRVFKEYKPQVVYHAAAHKHVPLMEDSPCEAIKNNVLGTYNTARAASENGCERFVLISTDKAVNPTNIMGASKRLCEMVIQCANKDSATQFVAVRFGNVLGSNGSVIPLFRKQIAEGGPVTVTDPNVIRYFMTIPEAVSLVLQASAMGNGGEIFVLDMGSPVKIADLAKNLIRLSGYVPGEDIEIVYTGLRPGEKLYEEKLMAEEGLEKTENDLIHIGHPAPIDYEKFFNDLSELKAAAEDGLDTDVIRMVRDITGTYKPDKAV